MSEHPLKTILGSDRFSRVERIHEHLQSHMPVDRMKRQWGIETTLMYLLDSSIFEYETTTLAAEFQGLPKIEGVH